MEQRCQRCEQRAAAIVYGSALLLCLGILTLVMQLWRADLRVPFRYDGDALLSGMLVKSVLDNGWYLQNSHLGMPTGQGLYDYPFGDTLHFAVIRLLALFFSSFGVILNVFYLLSFPLTTLCALFVFRRFGFWSPIAIVGSLLYAFLPYHFLRGEGHLFLAMYYLVPLIVLVILWAGSSEPWSRKRLLASVAICLLTALAGVYYAAFSCLLLLVAGAMRTVRAGRLAPMLIPGALAGAILLGSLLNILPNALSWHQHGKNHSVAKRSPSESELYGLQISQLVLPATHHRIAALADGKEEYNQTMLLVNENDDATLGIVGTCGFVLLLGCLLLRDRTILPAGLDQLAVLNLFAVLLATVGGFGSLIAFTLTPEIRGYNRISIFLAFFAIFAVVSCLDRWHRRSPKIGASRLLWPVLPGLLLVIGLLDQTNVSYVPDYPALKAQFDSDDRFVHQIEALNPHGKIFQFPYVPFPESPPVYGMTDYQHLRGYLHSQTLAWSYGAMRGRAGDLWQRQVIGEPVPQMMQSFRDAGFTGIWVDMDGFADGGRGEAAVLAKQLGQPLTNDNHHLLYFPLNKS